MDNQNNTEGGANIGGDINTWGGDFVGRDKIINNMIIDPIKGRVDELIDILNDRAAKIEEELQRYYEYAEVKTFLEKFKELHNNHVECLRAGNILRAHEILSKIHQLSYELERKVWDERHPSPGIVYAINPEIFFYYGPLISNYILKGFLASLGENSREEYRGFGSKKLFSKANGKEQPQIIRAMYQSVLGTTNE